MKNVIFFILVMVLVSACGDGRSSVQENEVEKESFQIISELHYSKPQDDFVFLKEALSYQVSSGGDTLIYSLQRDSTRFFPRNPEQAIANSLNTTPKKYDRTERFLNGELMMNEGMYKESIAYRLDDLKQLPDIVREEDRVKVFRLNSKYYKDDGGDTLLLNSTQYWTEKFGKIAQVDENFNRRSMRKMMLSKAYNSLGDTLYKDDMKELIFSDSSSWRLKSEGGLSQF